MRGFLSDAQKDITKMQEELVKVKVDVRNAGEGGGGQSHAQKEFNTNVAERLAEMEKEIERLRRIDTRLNKELVSKPYAYIDKVKAELAKE